ncbi:hypothetical protein AQ939_20930 [Burkholderia pseudomallei]|nr:hypothetical protein AQ939_20930 [Burkholderia pseudomallei]
MRAVPPPMIAGALCRTACPSLETFAMPLRASPPREAVTRPSIAPQPRTPVVFAQATGGRTCAAGDRTGCFFRRAHAQAAGTADRPSDVSARPPPQTRGVAERHAPLRQTSSAAAPSAAARCCCSAHICA